MNSHTLRASMMYRMVCKFRMYIVGPLKQRMLKLQRGVGAAEGRTTVTRVDVSRGEQRRWDERLGSMLRNCRKLRRKCERPLLLINTLTADMNVSTICGLLVSKP